MHYKDNIDLRYVNVCNFVTMSILNIQRSFDFKTIRFSWETKIEKVNKLKIQFIINFGLSFDVDVSIVFFASSLMIYFIILCGNFLKFCNTIFFVLFFA